MRKVHIKLSVYKLVFLSLTLFVTVILASITCCVAGNSSDQPKVLKDFLADVNAWQITDVECYYSGWSNPGLPISEKELIESKYDFKTSARFSSVFYFIELEKSLTFPKLEKVKNKESYDCKMAFLFYNGKQERFRITFTSDQPIVLINGQAYRPTGRLLRNLLPLLPKQAYDNFLSSMTELWVHSGPD